jgi:hypothetical protein
MPPVTEANPEFTPSWLPERAAVSLVELRLEYTEEYARLWIDREEKAGRLKSRRRTTQKWHVWATDWDNCTLQFSSEVIVELCLDGLVTAALLPAPKDNATAREGWWAYQLYAFMIGGEPSSLAPEMGPKILPAQRELTRIISRGRITPWDMSGEPKQVGRTAIVTVHGEWADSKGNRGSCTVFHADQAQRVFPRLDWLREEAEHYAAGVRAELPKLNNLIALDEANCADWTRFVELVATVGGNLENLTREEAAAVRLAHGFSSAQANAERRRALHEAEKIRRHIGDRIVKAVHAGQLVVTGRSASDLEVVRRIPANLVTADEIWSWLRSGEMTIYGQRYVDARIEQPEPPGAAQDAPPEAASPPPVDAGTAEAATSLPEPGALTDLIDIEAKPEATSIDTEQPPAGAKPEKAALPALPRGPRETWDWKELAEFLKEQDVFNSWADFVKFCQTSVQHIDDRPRDADPDTTVVTRAIKRHGLQNYAKIRGVNYSDDESP